MSEETVNLEKANNLKIQGVKAFVAFPDNWEVWVNSAADIPKDELEYKLFKKKPMSRKPCKMQFFKYLATGAHNHFLPRNSEST